MEKTKTKSALTLSIKALVSVGLLALLFWQLNFAEFLRIVSAAKLSYLSVAMSAYFGAKIITSARWALLARPLGFRISLKDFALFYFFGMFFNLVAPGTLGGDAGRVFYLCRGQTALGSEGSTHLVSRALVSVAADRAVGLAVLAWIGSIAFFVFPEYADAAPWPARAAIFVIALSVFFASLILPFAGSLLQRLKRASLIETLQEIVKSYGASPRLMMQVIVLSLIIHFMQAWIQIVIGKAIGLDIPWSYCFIFFPLVDILSMLPLSVSGIGLREGGYFFFLGKLGIGAEKAIACGMLWFGVVLANGLLGGVIFLFYRRNWTASSAAKGP